MLRSLVGSEMCIRDRYTHRNGRDVGSSSSLGIGISTSQGNGWIGNCKTDYAYYNKLGKRNSGNMEQYGGEIENGDVIGVELDMDQGTLRFSHKKPNGEEEDLGIAFSELPRELAFYPTVSFDAEFMCWEFMEDL
eukprot:TRINITY_DN51237_c0_g1_i1.p1 TRINITY_DN51237_c0_g1~~TRINITY_DN51237_c0_g1_i1.p1  ORF type:complete len:135 (+),score=24.61 TRINITY_DN51237_c0_g1_i1:140-544(+)